MLCVGSKLRLVLPLHLFRDLGESDICDVDHTLILLVRHQCSVQRRELSAWLTDLRLTQSVVDHIHETVRVHRVSHDGHQLRSPLLGAKLGQVHDGKVSPFD